MSLNKIATPKVIRIIKANSKHGIKTLTPRSAKQEPEKSMIPLGMSIDEFNQSAFHAIDVALGLVEPTDDVKQDEKVGSSGSMTDSNAMFIKEESDSCSHDDAIMASEDEYEPDANDSSSTARNELKSGRKKDKPVCPVCERKLFDFSALNKHLKSLHQLRMCIGYSSCNKVFSLEEFPDHPCMKQIDLNKTNFQDIAGTDVKFMCHVCHKTFSTKTNRGKLHSIFRHI